MAAAANAHRRFVVPRPSSFVGMSGVERLGCGMIAIAVFVRLPVALLDPRAGTWEVWLAAAAVAVAALTSVALEALRQTSWGAGLVAWEGRRRDRVRSGPVPLARLGRWYPALVLPVSLSQLAFVASSARDESRHLTQVANAASVALMSAGALIGIVAARRRSGLETGPRWLRVMALGVALTVPVAALAVSPTALHRSRAQGCPEDLFGASPSLPPEVVAAVCEDRR